jgi:hypothetical protein
MRNRNKHLDPDVTSAATLPSEAIRRFRKAATKPSTIRFQRRTAMSIKAKWIILGVLAAVALGFLEHHYKPCALEFLQRFVAVTIVSFTSLVHGSC